MGDTEPRRADFRLVSATHRDLAALVAEGRFRQDLLHRINTFPIEVPPLRARREDIPLLAEAMLEGTGKRLSRAAARRLRDHAFPGNVRELRNLLERAVILTDGDTIEPNVLPGDDASVSAPPPMPRDASWPWGEVVLPLDEVVDRYLRWAGETFEGERSELAERLGLSERTLYRRLRRAREE